MGRTLVVKYSADKGEARPFSNAADGCTVFVRSLSYDTTEDSIREFFSECGGLSSVRLGKDAEGYSKGFAFVEFESSEFSAKAVALSGSELDGRSLFIDYD